MKKALTWFLALAALVLVMPGVRAQTPYYIDASCATPGNGTTLTCDGDADDAWDDLSDITGLSAGDSVLLKRGETWRETLTVPTSGTSGNPITFGAYGSGADPEIRGADVEATWNSEAVSSGEDFTDGSGAQPEAWYYYEQDLLDESINNNDLTDNNTVAYDGTTFQQGSYSLKTDDDNSESASIACASTSANVPWCNASTDFTVGGWVRFWKAWDGGDTFFGVYDGASDYARIGLDFSNNIRARYNLGAGNVDILSDSNVSTGIWYHIVLRWQGSTDDELTLWINNGEQTTTQSPATWPDFSATMYFSDSGQTNPAAVLMDEWFLFDTALSDSQIGDIYTYGLSGGASYTVYYATGYIANPQGVWEDNAWLEEVGTKAELSSTGTWWWDDPNDRVYIRCSDDANPSTHTMEIGARDYGIDINAKDYITIDGITSGYASDSGIIVRASSGDSDNVIVQNCTTNYSYYSGIYATPGEGVGTDGDNLLIQNNTASYNGGTGIYVGHGSEGFTITSNTANYNCQEDTDANHDYCGGIRFGASDFGSGSVTLNTSHNNGDAGSGTDSGTGIWLDTNPDGSVVTITRNLVYNNYDHGIILEKANDSSVSYNISYGHTATASVGLLMANNNDNCVFYNNVSYGNDVGVGAYGDLTADSCTNNTIKNNIVEGSVSQEAEFKWGGENDGTNGYGNVYNTNCFGAEYTNFIEWGSTTFYSTYDAWLAASSQSDTNVEADPLFLDAASNNFRLKGSSPAINAGTDVGLTQDYDGKLIPFGAAPDIGAYEFYILSFGAQRGVAQGVLRGVVK
jgi:hypothetical protein